MLLFSRAVTLGGSPRRVGPWVQQVTDHVRSHSSLDVTAWSCQFGHPLGTVVWNALVESQADLAEATAGLASDGAYLDILESAEGMAVAPGEDALREILHGSPSEPPPLGAVATVTNAVALVDRMADAVGWGIEMAEHIGQVTDMETSVSRCHYGQMGQLTWIGVQPDIAAADAAGAKLRVDPGYISRLTGTAGLFIPGSGHVASFTRIA